MADSNPPAPDPAPNPAPSKPQPVQGSSVNSPRAVLGPIKSPKPPSRNASNAASPKQGDGTEWNTPIHKRTTKEMAATAVVDRADMSGPTSPRQPEHLGNLPAYLEPREEYKPNLFLEHDKLEKDRLMKRRFGHVRHDCYYKDLTKPPTKESPAFMDPKRKEFWRTDVEKVVRRHEDARRGRQKELLNLWTNEEAWRRESAQNMREIKYQAYLDLATKMAEVGNRPNKSGAPHINIITREAIKPANPTHAIMSDFQEAVKDYKKAARTQFIREKSSGARNFNILSWEKNPPGPSMPPWPKKPPPPPPPVIDHRTPLNTSKGALSFGRVYGAFGTLNVP